MDGCARENDDSRGVHFLNYANTTLPHGSNRAVMTAICYYEHHSVLENAWGNRMHAMLAAS